MKTINADVVVLGAGVGGYTSAFYAADRGRQVLLVEQESTLGGVCLQRGCIPSKALLHATKMAEEAEHSGFRGIEFSKPTVDVNKLRTWKESVIAKMTGGLKQIAKIRGVTVMTGRGYFEDAKTLRVETSEGQQLVTFNHMIIAAGSRPALPKAFDLGNPRIMTSTEALELPDIPETLLVVGGGYIGMELGTVYAGLGSKVTLVEAMPGLLGDMDADLLRPVLQKAQKSFKELRFGVKVTKMSTAGKKIKVNMEVDGKKLEELYDRVLVSVGRTPLTSNLGIENAGIEKDEKGFIRVNEHQQTAVANIYAVGDIVGGLMLAHKASKEARIAVENITGEHTAFKNIIIPAVVFTDPEVAWAGITENEAKKQNIPHKVARFPWGASGRAVSFDRPDGLTKLIIDPDTERVLGVAVCGAGAGELIAEGVLAIETGLTARDLAECVHPHPTLSETIMEAAEVFYGTSSHMASARNPQRSPQEVH